MSPLTSAQQAAVDQMVKFLNICDDDPPEKAVAVRVATMLVKGGAKSPKLVSGLSQEEIEAMYCYGALDMDAKLVLKLAVQVAKAMVTAKHNGAEGRPPATPMGGMLGQQTAAQAVMTQVMGSEAPPRVIKQAIAETPDVKKALLVPASFEGLPHGCQADISVFQSVKAETARAEKENRRAFNYIELASEQVAPLWMQMAMIGSKSSSLPGAEDHDSGEHAFVAMIGRTMQQMAKRGRYFVNMTQWPQRTGSMCRWLWPTSTSSWAMLWPTSTSSAAWPSWPG